MQIAINPSIPQRVRAMAATNPALKPEEIARVLGLMTSQVKAALVADRRRLRPDGTARR